MQKKIVAVAATLLCVSSLPALAQSTGASKVELWGIVDAAVRHTNNEGENKKGLTKMIGGGMSQSRWGINVEEDLGAGSKALVHLENRFNADTGEKDEIAPFFQLSYVGLQGPYGRLTMGRQWNVLFDVVTSTYASFPYSPYMDAYKPELGMAAGARSSNSMKYTLATADRSLVATLQYSFKEGNNGAGVYNSVYQSNSTLQSIAAAPLTATPAALNGATVKQAIDATANNLKNNPSDALKNSIQNVATGAMKNYGGFLRYSKYGMSVGAGYLRTELPAGSKLDAWTFGGSFRSGKLYLNAGYGLNKVKYISGSPTTGGAYAKLLVDRLVDSSALNAFWEGQTNGGFQAGDADKRQMYKIGFGYQVTPQINAGLHYFHAKQSGSVGGKSNGKADFLVALANYAFSKRTDAYFGIDHTKVSGGSSMYLDSTSKARKRTGITVGLRHRF